MKSVPLNAFPRALGTRAGAKKLRASGRIPAVIYGRQAKPQNLEVSAKEMEDLIHHSVSENLLVDLAVKDDARPKRLALVQEIQHHPLSGKVLHVDFHEVAEDEKVTVMVPVETVGEAVGVKTDGGVLEHVLFKIKVRGLPKDLPEAVTVDVSHLKIGEAIHLGDIKPPAGRGNHWRQAHSGASPSPRRARRKKKPRRPPKPLLPPGEVEMIKEKKEEGEEGAAARPKAPRKAAAKAAARRLPRKAGEKAAAAAAADKKAAAGRREEEVIWTGGPAPAGRPGQPRAWRICISSWAWAIPGAEYARTRHNAGFLVVETLGRALAGGLDATKRSSTRGWRGRSAAGGGCCCASRRRS